MKMKRIMILLFLAFGLLSSLAWVEEEKEIRALEVIGNRRVGTLIILARVKTRVGDKYSSLIIREDVKRLYDLGYFSDIRVEVTDYEEAVKVTFIVEEEPLVREINLEGVRALKEKTLREVMVLKAGEVFNERLLNEDVQRIASLYREKGYYLVKVEREVVRLEEVEEIIINISIEEGVEVRVKEISIEGNHSFPAQRIKKIMATRVDRLFARRTFQEKHFQSDLERIISFYQNEGFLKARIVDTEKRLDEERGLLYLTIKVEEGPQFKVGRISFEGNVLFSDEELKNELKMVEGHTYSPFNLKQDVRRIKVFYAHKGYIFAEVGEEVDIKEEERKVDLFYRIAEGGLAYVERIDIRGNVRTKDKVLRRELTIKPGDVFDAHKIERSREKLHRLGYFDEVGYYTEPGSVPHKKNLIFEVIERKTGAFMFGFGYCGVDEFIGFIEISQSNFDIKNPPTFTGGGQDIRLKAQLGTKKTEYDLSFTEPWLFDRPLSAGFDIYDTARQWADYDEGRQGGRLRLGYPLGEWTRGSLAYKLEDVEIFDVDEDASIFIKREEGTFTTSSLELGVVKDTRDSILAPTRGYRNSFSAEVAGGILGGDRDFIKYVGETSWHFRTFERWPNLILNLRLKGGWVGEYGETEYVPIYERFYLGGAHSVRGYAHRDIGPKDEKGYPIGGEVFLQFNAEYTYPIVRNIKGAVFFDSGGVWEDTGDIDSRDLESGVGIGLRLNLPIGPIRLDYGWALDRGEGRVHFTGGWGF